VVIEPFFLKREPEVLEALSSTRVRTADLTNRKLSMRQEAAGRK
jgi:hypothetical protein